MTDIGKLKVGRASAGSGKTFTLTVEYITLLVENPDNYRHILAVTFTNKATTEMKTRIIQTLHSISAQLPEGEKYLRILIDHFRPLKKEAEIWENCTHALSLILHDYTHFRIETIDSFFQSIIRDLARELNLTANLRIDLDQDEALEDAVHQMIEHMHQGDDIYNAVLAYVQDNMNTEQKNWKIESEVVEFSKNIFNEKYLTNEKSINQQTGTPGFFVKYKKRLNETLTEIGEQQIANAKAFENYCHENHLEKNQFIGGGTGVYAFFPKIIAGKSPKELPVALRASIDADWLKDSHLNSCHKSFFRHLIETESDLRKQKNTLNEILKHVNQMSLLGSVDSTIRQINNETNRFILAETAYKLHEIISDNDIPFIFEKTATSLKYIMIDEFQDTSELQWKNFIPLLKECIDKGCMCLIVGDVKQSIYRWRNSDWGILNNINQSSVFQHVIDDKQLQKALGTNHRSDGNIVLFNNKFFEQACQDVRHHYDSLFQLSKNSGDILTAYHEVVQQIRHDHEDKGFIDIIDLDDETSMLEKDDTSENENNDSTDEMLNRVSFIVHELLEQHQVAPNDIAILTRSNNHLKILSNHLKEELPSINIISGEAYQLDSSEAVSIIMLALQVISGFNRNVDKNKKLPFNHFLCATLAFQYQKLILHRDFQQQQIDNFFQSSLDELAHLLPDSFINRIEELQILPLYELCEQLYNIFNLKQIDGQSEYLFYFMDEVAAYINDKTSDLNSFISFWNEKLHSKTIPEGNADGIHLLTIHKSKGLEFHTVIVPYCYWEMGGKPSVMWCKPPTTSQLPVIPISFTKNLQNSDFQIDYEEEELKNYVDNLNLLYVAFTRASHNLIIITGKNKIKSDNGYSARDVILSAKSEMNFPIGEIVPHQGIVESTDSSLEVKYRNSTMHVEFRQSNRSADFVNGMSEDTDTTLSYINKGLVVHKVFEMITNESDIPKAISQLKQEGVLNNTSFVDEITQFITQSLANPNISRWFSPHWKVMNECSIVTTENGIITNRRPDRVVYDDHETIVIDYKTGIPVPKHRDQLRNYISLLTSMGMPHVHGYIWYMKDNHIVNID